MDAALLHDDLDGLDEFRCDALAAEMLRNRQIVDVELAALLFNLVMDVAGQATDDLACREGCDGDQGISGKAPGEVRLAGLSFEVRPRIMEGVTEESQHLAERWCIKGTQDSDRTWGGHLARCEQRLIFSA